MRFKSIVSVVLLFSALGLISCQFSSEDKKDPIKKVNETDIRTVTSDTFINGKKFCDLYVNNGKEISKEYGKWIQVPKDYDHPGEMINIYAYTRKPFDPSLPSFIFVDGGPGQNTHQSEDLIGEVTKEDKFKKEEFNQINLKKKSLIKIYLIKLFFFKFIF
ncbi:MAG: hypothetical protein KDD45_09745, partial [Bdellovibrionales bacterium]|nr:hypothetical protein [Bdellovibrionales bacterium]